MGGGVSLGVDSEVSKTHARPSLALYTFTLWITFKLSAIVPAASYLLACPPTCLPAF